MATPNLGFQNFFSTTLSGSLTATDTTVYLNSVPTPSEGYLVIEPDSASNREIIYYTSKGANFVTLPSVAAGRGVGGTSAGAHSSGVAVQMNVTAEHFKALQDGTAITAGGIGASAYDDGWIPWLGVTPDTVTANGNRNYDLVFNGEDYTDQISPGMKLRLTRTVAAPDQCADLEASSSQYFSKSSPAGMTFTDDFAVSAWIKVESYAQMAIASRYNGTSGWAFRLDSTGAVTLVGYNAGATNFRYVTSYASVPLNKWIHVSAQLDMSAHTATTTTSYVMFDGLDVPAFVGQGGTNPTALIQAGNLEIGGQNGGTTPFDGKIAQVAIYSAKVTQATIKASMNQALSGSETSLISAYSLDNSLNDLNANANNLTANGGAAATATDSPFANAVAAGLLEYAEVNSVTFSTNTTVNVRVPDTCMIPTSGGVSAVSYSTQSNPYGLPYFSKVLGSQLVQSNQTTTTALQNRFSIVAYIPTNARIRVTLVANDCKDSGASGGTSTYINQDSVNVSRNIFYPLAANVEHAHCNVVTLDPTPGNHTYTVSLNEVGGVGTATFAADTTYPMRFWVELV